MATINLKGPLNLAGTLTFKDKLTIAGTEALIQADNLGTAPPVLLPPPPATPVDQGTDVSIVASFNQNVKAGSKAIVALGMVLQGSSKTWPGMMLSSQTWEVPKNTGKYGASVTPSPAGSVTALSPSPLDVNILWAGATTATSR